MQRKQRKPISCVECVRETESERMSKLTETGNDRFVSTSYIILHVINGHSNCSYCHTDRHIADIYCLETRSRSRLVQLNFDNCWWFASRGSYRYALCQRFYSLFFFRCCLFLIELKWFLFLWFGKTDENWFTCAMPMTNDCSVQQAHALLYCCSSCHNFPLLDSIFVNQCNSI